MNLLGEQLRARWARRSTREQALLGGGAIVLGLSLLYAQIWFPVSQALVRAESSLPRLRADFEAFVRDRDQVVALRTQASSIRLDMAGAQAAAREAARKAGIESAIARIEPVGDGKVRVVFSQVAFAAWLGWTEKLQREQKLFVESARVESLPLSGMAKIELILAVGNAP